MLCRKPPVTSVGGFGELVINYLEPQNKMFRVVSNPSYSVLFSGKKNLLSWFHFRPGVLRGHEAWKKSAYNLNERVLERSGGENSCPCITTRSIVRIICIYYAHMGGAAIQPRNIIDIITNPL